MRRFLLLLLLSSAMMAFADDIIITRSAQKINAIIEEVGSDYIKFHKSSDPTGPIFRMETSEIASVIYSNGEVQAFDAPALQQQNPVVAPAYPQQGYAPQPYPQQPFVDYKAIERQRKDSIRAEKKAAKKAAFKAKMDAIPKTHFLLANYSYSFNKSHNVGLTYGWCHAVGVSINAMLGVSGFHYSPDGHMDSYSEYTNSHLLLTNNHTHQRVSIAPGLLVRLGCPVYLNAALGYAYDFTTYKATTGEWIQWSWPYEAHCMVSQFGLWADIKGFSLSVAYSGYGWEDRPWVSEVMVGVGFAIPTKKGGQK